MAVSLSRCISRVASNRVSNAQAWIGKLQGMTDTLQENALFGQANALKLDSVARAIKVGDTTT